MRALEARGSAGADQGIEELVPVVELKHLGMGALEGFDLGPALFSPVSRVCRLT